EERQKGEQPGREVAIGGEGGEARGQVGADDAREYEDKPKETEAVQSRDGAVRFDPVHRLKPGQDVRAEAKQPRDVTEDEMCLEEEFRRHFGLRSGVD